MYRICWKERGTGRVVKEDALPILSEVIIQLHHYEAMYPHLYWIEDEAGTFIEIEEGAPVLV